MSTPPQSFEDVDVGATDRFGTYDVTADEITSFAEQYDPQIFHTNPEAAASSPFGGLIASGWHTAAITQRLLVDNFLRDSGAIGSPGIADLRWRRPVRPGAELGVDVEITDAEPWDDDRGLVRVDVHTRDSDGEVVMTMEALLLFPRT